MSSLNLLRAEDWFLYTLNVRNMNRCWINNLAMFQIVIGIIVDYLSLCAICLFTNSITADSMNYMMYPFDNFLKERKNQISVISSLWIIAGW